MKRTGRRAQWGGERADRTGPPAHRRCRAGTAVGAGAILTVVLALAPGVEMSAVAAGERPRFQMPFTCQQRWEGSTRPTHSPSSLAVDWNRDAHDLGKPVTASAAGVVTSVVDLGNRSYGLYVVVDHGGGWTTLYAHLEEAFVAPGQRVDQGQLIALLGSSGGSTGPHLHFEERRERVVQHASFNGLRFRYDTWLTSRNCVDVPLVGDWNGDHRYDVGVFARTAGAARFRQLVPGVGREVTTFGAPTDQPVLGDWNGDGQTDLGVRNPLTGAFRLAGPDGSPVTIRFGGDDDLPVSGDWDGDGRWDVGVHDARTQVFFLRNGQGNFTSWYVAGTGLPITGDWDGDGRWDLGYYDPALRAFALRMPDGTTKMVRFGSRTSLPVVGFWNADRVSDLGVWNTATGEFSLRLRPKQVETIRFGKIR